MTGQRALSRRQPKESNFDGSMYRFNYEAGEFIATIDCNRWGKRKKQVAYMTFEDGCKIVALTWPRSNYEGLANVSVGSRIRVTYMINREGAPCIRKVVLLGD